MEFRIAVAGASGHIGHEVLNVLCEHEVPFSDVTALASSASKGMEVSYGEDDLLKVHSLEAFDFKGTDVVFFATDAKTAAKYAPKATAAGCTVIDLSGQFHMEPGVPLVVPEVNGDSLADYQKKHIIANPRAVSILLALCLKPLHEAAVIKRVVVATYQAASAQGKAGMDELFRQTRGVYVNESPADSKEVYPKQVAFNVIPQIDNFQDDGSTREEWALAAEIRKIVSPDIAVQATCCTVPVFIGYGMAVTIETENPLSDKQARDLLRQAPGLSVVDHRVEEGYVTPAEVPGEDPVFVSRIRRDPTVENGLAFWCAGDNLRKGAALNAVQIALTLRDEYID